MDDCYPSCELVLHLCYFLEPSTLRIHRSDCNWRDSGHPSPIISKRHGRQSDVEDVVPLDNLALSTAFV